MKIKVGMMYDANVPFGREVEEINKAWADLHGYAFVSQHALPDPTLDPFWNRLPFIAGNLKDCDWFFWMDADVIVVNSLRQLEPYLPEARNLVFSSDYNGLCCGAFAVRSCEWSLKLLYAWLFLGNVSPNAWRVFDSGFMREQTTIKTLRRIFPSVDTKLGTIPESLIQNMHSPYARDALAYHVWAGYVGEAGVRRVLNRLKTQGYVPHMGD